MQQSRVDRLNHSLVVRSQTAVRRNEVMAVHYSRMRQLFHSYLASLSFVRTVVKIIQVTRYVLAFIFAHLFRAKMKKRQKDRQTYISAPRQTPVSSNDEIEDHRMKDNFLLMASHELKTPMTTILGQAQLIRRRLARIPELSSDLTFIRGALESIDSQTRRLNALVDDLLDMYNLRAGKIELHLKPCDLVNLCYEVIREQRLLTGRAILLDVPSSPVIMQADEARLSQVIVNLVNNALKYSPPDSIVQVFVDKRRDIDIIEVADTGPGIPQEDRAHIFEPFYRSPNVCTTSKSGLGLGLAICKDIVQRHGGRIWCRSQVGRGSTFIVEMPLKGYVSRERFLSR